MKLKPIFSDKFLSHYLPDFRLSSVTDIRGINLLIKDLIEELESGKIESMKEEEFKSRFLSTFFGDILGFNYGNSNKWQLREEKKSTTDGTKPDGALGYFFVDADNDNVRAVIEIKDANTDLDVKQKRVHKKTPIEQAFGYVSKAGGNCNWVIVSNVKEIRFYPSLDQARCQIFFLKDLEKENKLKELLFLFHKDRFIKEYGKSSTDKLFQQARIALKKDSKPIHIIDKIYNSLKRFEGLKFVDPSYIATIFPFNILDDYVWQYHNNKLFTINGEIYKLLIGIRIEGSEIRFSKGLEEEIFAFSVLEAKSKLEWIFTFLNHSLIEEITAIKDYKQIKESRKKTIGFSVRHIFNFEEGEEGITQNINIIKGETCNCLSCVFRSLSSKES